MKSDAKKLWIRDAASGKGTSTKDWTGDVKNAAWGRHLTFLHLKKASHITTLDWTTQLRSITDLASYTDILFYKYKLLKVGILFCPWFPA